MTDVSTVRYGRGIFMAYRHPDGRIDNAWFFGPVELVRWLKIYAGPLHVVSEILVLIEG